MSDAPLTEQLDLDIAAALAQLDHLGEALDTLVTNFSTGLEAALQGLSSSLTIEAPTVDASGITDSVTAALEAIPPLDVPVEADTSQAADSIAALEETQLSLFADADTSAAADSITALSDESITVGVHADTAEAQAALDDLSAAPIEIPVEADTSGAQESLSALGDTAGTAGGGISGLKGSVSALNAAAGAAVGSAGGLKSAIAGISTETGLAVGAGAAFTGFLAAVVPLAADAQAQTARFNETFGALAESVKHIDVGGLNITLEDLGKQSGTTAANIDAAASKIGLLGKSAGASGDQIVQATDNVLALAAALSVQNPRLGDTAAVADKLNRALATGGRFAAQLGLSLQAADIRARAQEIAGAGNEVTRFDLVTAGAQLAVEQFGNTLGTTFQKGSENAQVQLRALKVQLEETLVAIGQPLLSPLISSFQAFLPVAQALGTTFGSVLGAILPIIAALAPALVPVAAAIADVAKGITALESVLGELSPAELLGIAAGIIAIAVASGEAAIAVAALGDAIAFALGPVGIAIGALALLGAAFGVFHKTTQTVKVDAKDLSDALLATGGAADVLTGKALTVSDALAEQLRKTLDVGSASQKALDGVNQFGLSFSDLTKQLLGTRTGFENFLTGLTLNVHGTKDQQEAQLHLIDALGQTRDQLEATSSAALDAAVANHTLTQAQVDAAEKTSDGLPSLEGSVTAYLKLKPAIDAAAAATTAAAVATGTLQQGFVDLKPAIADGTVTASDAQQVADELGISVGDATAAINSLTTAFNQFVSTGLAALPQASAAFDDFQSHVDSAFGAVVQAGGAAGSTAIASATQQVADAQKAANQAVDSAGQSGANAVDTARQRLADAQARLLALQNSGTNATQSQIDSATHGVKTAGEALARAEQTAADQRARAISTGGERVATAEAALNKAQTDQATKAKKAQDDLLFALDPQRVIDAENKNTLAILSFQNNLTTLIARGRDNVVALLVAEGPQKGGLLAQSLVNDDVKAKALDAGVALANKTTQGYSDFLEAHKAQLSGRLITLANGQIVDLTNTLSAGGVKAGGALLQGVAAGLSGAQLANIPPSVRRAEGLAQHSIDAAVSGIATQAEAAGKAAAGAFTNNFKIAAPAGNETAAVGPAITAKTPAAAATAKTESTAISTAFTGGLNFASGVPAAFLAFDSALNHEANIAALNANRAGGRVGHAFGVGFRDALASGLTAGGPIPLPTLTPTSGSSATVPNVRPPTLRPTGGGTGQVHTTSTATRTAEVNVTLHRTDPDPFQLAQEIGFAVG